LTNKTALKKKVGFFYNTPLPSSFLVKGFRRALGAIIYAVFELPLPRKISQNFSTKQRRKENQSVGCFFPVSRFCFGVIFINITGQEPAASSSTCGVYRVPLPPAATMQWQQWQ
jgi:hypothetical protein